jgi:arylsulfatase A-like enzyme
MRSSITNPSRDSNALIEVARLKTHLGVVQMRALVTNNYKLVFYPGLRETMLFDLKNDPQELRNLARLTEYQSVVNVMLEELLRNLARTEMPAHRIV